MKILALILSLYVTWLTTIPCIDVPQENSAHKTELSRQNQDNRHQDDVDHCSPFCTCNCCQTNIDIVNATTLSPTLSNSFQYYDISSTFQSPELLDFLIPPKA